MPIAFDGQVYKDEFEFTASQLPSSGVLRTEREEWLDKWGQFGTTSDGKVGSFPPTDFIRDYLTPTQGNPYINENMSPMDVTRGMRFKEEALDQLPAGGVEDRRGSPIPEQTMSQAFRGEFNNLPDAEEAEIARQQAAAKVRMGYEKAPSESAAELSNILKFQSGEKTPIIGPEGTSNEDTSRLPRFTVTPELANKPMNEPFKNEEEKRGVWNALTGADGKDRYQTWPEKAVRDMIDAFKLPGDVFSGETKLPSKAGVPGSAEATGPEGKALGRVAELAGAMIFGPAPIANKIVDGTLGSIAGVTAKGADKEALQVAQKMISDGYHPDDIYRYTGWYKGAEGKWKFEIDSSQASLHMPEKVPSKLGELLDFPDLYIAYPALKDIDLSFKPTKGYAAIFNPNDFKITINPKYVGKQEELIDTILHEVQHAIQSAEGFDHGSNYKHASDAFINALNRKYVNAQTPAEAQEVASLLQRARTVEDKLGTIVYHRNPGEREARLVEERRYLTPAYKREVSPMKTQKYIDDFLEQAEFRIPGQDRAPISASDNVKQLRRAAKKKLKESLTVITNPDK